MAIVDQIKAEIIKAEQDKVDGIIESSVFELKFYLDNNVRRIITKGVKNDDRSITEYHTPQYYKVEDEDSYGCMKIGIIRNTPKKYLSQIISSEIIKDTISKLNEEYKPIKISIDYNIFGVIYIDVQIKPPIIDILYGKLCGLGRPF